MATQATAKIDINTALPRVGMTVHLYLHSDQEKPLAAIIVEVNSEAELLETSQVSVQFFYPQGQMGNAQDIRLDRAGGKYPHYRLVG